MTDVVQTKRAAVGAPPLAVQEVSRPPAPFLRFVDQVVEDGASGIEFRFSQGLLTRFDLDVIHVLDSELDYLLGAPQSATLQRLIATSALARNLRRHGIALIRTLVEELPREGTALGRRARRILDDATTHFVVQDSAVASPAPERTSVIPHAHFRDRFVGFPLSALTPNLVLIPASAELPEEAVPLLSVPRVSRTPGLNMRLIGLTGAEGRTAAASVLARHPHLGSTRWERISDGSLAAEITAAELIVLPRVTSPSDLQMAFVALSLDRPVLTCRTPVLADLATQIGPGWLFLADGAITATDIDHALARTRDIERAPRPDLSGRALDLTRNRYAELFQKVTLAQVR